MNADPASCSKVDELKQRIRVLQAVGFGALEADDSAADVSSAPAESARADVTQGVAPMEALLLQKNRQLEHAFTMARLKLSEATGELLVS